MLLEGDITTYVIFIRKFLKIIMVNYLHMNGNKY